MARLCFVTVGTTEFDQLVETVCARETLETLRAQGFTKLRLQIGRGQVEPPESSVKGLLLEWYRYKPSIWEDLLEADLVICHAGAGTCLETLELRPRKPLLVVINETLMNNHQVELAAQLERDGHLCYCTPARVRERLEEMVGARFEPWKKGEPKLFARWIDAFVGVGSKK